MQLLKVTERKVATKNQEYRYHEKNGLTQQHRPENYPEETELLWSHMQDARRQAPKASCFWHNGWQKKQNRKI